MFTPLPDPSRFLATHAWFAALCADEQRQVLSESYTLRAPKGAVLLAAGEAVQGWYAVLSGLVMLHSANTRGKPSAFVGVPEGEWFGEGSAMKAEHRRYDVVALRETVLLCLPLERFNRLRQRHLAFIHYLCEHLNVRLGQAMAIIEAGRVRSPEHRVALYLSRLFWRSNRHIQLTQEELGHLAGLSRQTVNRGLQVLVQQRIVTLDLGRIAVRDDAALNAFLQASAAS